MEKYIYDIDKAGIFLSISNNWNEFAEENSDNKHLATTDLIGKSIWSVISDNKVNYLYQQLIEKAFKKDKIEISYRCDSPCLKRFMKMKIKAVNEEIIRFISSIEKVEKREYNPLIDSRVSHSDELITMCSFCKKVNIKREQWFDVDEAIVRLNLFMDKDIPEITHGVCEDCFEIVMAEIEKK